jgi:muramoyltetrapeptide carboxypeptidase
MKGVRASARPRALREGGCIGVCAPAGPVSGEALDHGLGWLESRGYRVRCGPHVRDRRGYLAGDDDARLADLQALITDPEVDCVLAARGGYGITRILHRLDVHELVRARKLFVGYSDSTALSLLLLRSGLASIHGPMLERDDLTEAAKDRWLALARGEAAEPLQGEPVKGGRVAAPLVGGNLKLLAASVGTPWEVCTEGAILFVEEIGEQPYAIDRSLIQLRDAGKLAGLAGVAVGQLVNCESERYPEISACDVVRDVLAPEISGPVVGGLPFGHIADNRALGVGVQAELDGDAATLRLTEAVVEDGT